MAVIPGATQQKGRMLFLVLSSGTYNTALGFFSLRSNTTGKFNTAIGAGTLLLNTGDEKTATGATALLSNTTGSFNTASGTQALLKNTTGNFNTANGFEALYGNITGDNNTANGYGALVVNVTGSDNTANGVAALRNNFSGGSNVANGAFALYNNTFGDLNTAIGGAALQNNTNGRENIALGYAAGRDIITADNVIAIGAPGVDVRRTCFIGNIYATTTVNATTLPVVVSPDGQLGTSSSSQRFKKEIKPMNQISEAILRLKPVTFHYKTDNKGTPQFGLIAEEVAEEPDSVVRDEKGEIYTVRYDAVNAMLLNEFLKDVPESRPTRSQSAGSASNHRRSKNDGGATAERHGASHCASGRAGFKNPEVSDQRATASAHYKFEAPGIVCRKVALNDQ